MTKYLKDNSFAAMGEPIVYFKWRTNHKFCYLFPVDVELLLRKLYFRPQQIIPNDESWDDEIVETVPVEYHQMSLPRNAIHLIDSPCKFESFLDTGFQVI